jgi:general secretion pathway protein K
MNREGGYAMIAAVAGVAAFAFIAFETLAVYRGEIASVGGQLANAQMRASADAGLTAAIYGLSIPDTSQRWPIDGRARTMQFGDSALTIVVEDEHGKIPINRLNEDEIRQMFSVAGASGDRLDELVDTMQDWTDEDDDARPHGAEAPDYVAQGVKPRNSDFESVGELALVKGMDSELYAKIAPAITVFFGETGSFSVETAQPLALAVMSDSKLDAPDVIERQREMAGERPAFDSNAPPPPPNLVGRPLTVRVTVRDPQGGTFQRSTIIELTGTKSPYWTRFVE